MPSSAPSPDDLRQTPDSTAVTSVLERLARPRPGLRVAAVLTAMGSAVGGAQAQDVFNGGGVDGSIFEANDNWDGGTYPGDDFGTATIDFSGGSTIDVTNLIIGVGGMTNSSNGDIVLDGTGSWSFDAGGASITPGTGSFTFELDVTALGNVTFELADGSIVFNGTFDTSGGVMLANDGVVDFNGAVNSAAGTTWQGAGGGGFSFAGTFTAAGDQTFDSTDGSVAFGGNFDAQAGTMLFLGGVVDIDGTTTSADGVAWHVDDSDVNFLGDFEATGNQDFVGLSGVVTDDILTFDANTTFTAVDADPAAAATFDAVSAAFTNRLVIDAEDPDAATGSAYAFVLLNESLVSIAEMEVNTETFRFDLGLDSVADVLGEFRFSQDNATLVVDGSGTLGVTGETFLANSFRLIADSDTTINWNARTDVSGTTLVDPNDPDSGENPNWIIDTSGGAGNVTLNITGAIVGDEPEAIISVTTDGDDDDVRFSNDALRSFTGTILVNDGSAVTFSGGGSGGSDLDGVGLDLGAGSEVFLAPIDPAGGLATNNFLFQELDDIDIATAQTTAMITMDSSYDATVTVRNGIFAGEFRDIGTGDLSIWWALGTSRFNGIATVDGTYEIKNTAVHRIGTFETDLDGDGNDDTIRATVDAGTGFLVTQASGILAYADVATDGDLELRSGATSAASLVIQNSSTFTALGDFIMNESSILKITGESTIADGINLDIGGISTIDGTVLISAESDRTADPADPLAWIANANFDGAATIGSTGSLTLSNSAYATFGDTLDVANGVTLEDTSYLAVAGTFTQSGGTTLLEAGTTLTAGDLILQDGSTLQLFDTDLNDAIYSVIETDTGIVVESGATLFGSGEIAMAAGDLEYAGIVGAGAMGASEGLLHITSGDLIAQAGGELHFGLDGDLALVVTDGIGQSSIIQVDGNVDFTNSGLLVVDVVNDAYIPTDLTFTLLEASNFIGDDQVDLQAGAPSVTRTWDWGIDTLGLLDRLYAECAADYTNTLTGEQLVIGGLLNSFIPNANQDPTGAYGQLLGQLDQIQTAAEYQAAITGLEPTAQISAIQVTALSQYHEVLRREIRQRFTEAERRTPAPFRAGDPMQLMSADDTVATRSIRRASTPDATAQGFGTFWGRDLKTPTEGDVVGLDGHEYGGFGGFAWDLSDSVVAGFDLGYSAFTGTLDGNYGNTRIGTVRGGGFATWSNDGGLFIDGAVSAAWNHYDFTRLVPSTNLSAISNADGWQVDVSVGGGYRMELAEAFAITPQGSFLYSYINTGEIDENSSSVAALSIDPGELSAFIGRVGIGASWSALPGVVIDGELGWQGNFTDNGDYNVGLSGFGTDVPIEVKDQTINTGYYGLGISWTPTRNVAVNLNWEGRSGDGLRSSMLFGGISIGF